jgi:hypothetical protein
MKLTGAELQQFMDHGWPGDEWYWDHEAFDAMPDPAATYNTDDLGPLIYQGSELDRPDNLDLGRLVTKWRKARDFDLFTITVKKSDTEKVRAALAAVGVSI